MKINFAIFIIVLSYIALSPECFCQETILHRPTVGLVLSGGGAKGIAHVGVLKVLEEAGIRPDFIGGTSMGGIVGGLYAMGYSADTIETIAKSIKWSYYLSDDVPRTAITIEEKEDHDRFVLSVPIAEKGIKIPGGVINGQNIENLLSQLCAPVFNIRDFNKLQIPFLCNATDMVTGKEVIFRDGYLPSALRATMAIPSIFNPIDVEGKLLVDGGLVNNFPAELVKNMGADILIGVDVGFQYYPKDQLNSMFRIIEQSLFFYGETNSTRNKKLCNIVISPSLGKLNAGSFNMADSLISIGETAARKIFPQLKALGDSLRALDPSFRPNQQLDRTDSLFLSEIIVYGLDGVSGDLLAGKLQLPLLKMVTPKDIGEAVDRLYSSFYFEKVNYEIEKTDTGIRLILRVKENADGSLRFGLHYDSNNKSAILINTTFRNLIFAGSKLALNAGLGDNPYFKTEYFNNNGWKPGLGVAFQSSRTQEYMYNSTHKIASLNLYETKLQLYTQSIFRNSYALGGGIEFENSLIRPVIDPGESYELSRYKLINYYTFVQMDSYDNLFYPTRGIKWYSGIKLITSKELSPIVFFHSRLSKAVSLSRRITLIGHTYAGMVDGDSIPTQYLFFSGGSIESYRNGIMPFTGMDYMQTSSKNLLSVRIDLQMRFYNKIYAIGEVNAGNFKNSFNDLFSIHDIAGGYGVTLGYSSLIGPIEMSVSRSANHGGFLGFVRIGFWF
jgi:NTE family protein